MTEPKDYDDRQPQQSEQVAEQVAGVLKTVGRQKPELLWILLLVVVIEGAQLYEAANRVAATTTVMASVTEHIKVVETNRQEENRRLQESNRMLVQTIARQSDRIGRSAANYTDQLPEE